MANMADMADMASILEPRINQKDDKNIGSAEAPPSLSSLVSTLLPVLLFALVWFALFILFRKWFARNYRPRTFLGSLNEHERSPKISDSFFGWIPEFYAIPDTWILNHHTLDGYLFIRFLKVAVACCLVGCVITWPVLFPIDATGGGGQQQLNIITMGNVTNNYYKMFAHAGCAILFFSFVMFMITRESIFYINLRQAYLLSPLYSSRISSRTVLFTSVPDAYMDKEKLGHMLGSSVRRIWFATETKELEDKVEERDKAAYKLEGAETKLIQTANKNRLKAEKKGGSADSAAIEDGQGQAARYVSTKDRPTHRLKFLIGKKVDTIDWCRSELKRLVPEVDTMQADQKHGNSKKLNSVFVEFETMSEAQAAYQSLTHHQVLQMAPRFTGMTPGDVIWSNLKIRWWERGVRYLTTNAICVVLVIFWSIPVALIGAISNINAIVGPTGLVPQLGFILKIPHVILGVVTGLLPVVLLAVLMALLPIFLRLMARIGGAPTWSQVELTVQNTYFMFQVVQVFLVATLGSAATAVIQQVKDNPSSVTTILAQKLPAASTFYLSYFILQGLGIVSSVLVGLVGLLLFMVLGKLLDKTPRKMYKRWISLSGVGWGTLYPVYTNLFVIAICYAVIAPLVLGFAAIGLYFFYFAYRYNFMFVSNATIDTKGRSYTRALQQLFVGLYLAEGCLIGLFAIATGSSIGALGPLILMIVFLIFTVLYQIALNSALSPLLNYLPKSMDAEERHLLEMERAEHDGEMHNGNGNSSSMDREKIGEHASSPKDLSPAPHKKPNFIIKFLRPDIYTDYATMRRLVPKDIEIHYSQDAENDAYFHPSVTSTTPLLWVPRDPLGLSRTECAQTSEVIPMTDEGAYLDEKNKIVWDADDGRPPIYEEKVYY